MQVKPLEDALVRMANTEYTLGNVEETADRIHVTVFDHNTHEKLVFKFER